jgi:hypothetical protein
MAVSGQATGRYESLQLWVIELARLELGLADEGIAPVPTNRPLGARLHGHAERALAEQLAERVGDALAHRQLVETGRSEVRSGRRRWVNDETRRQTTGAVIDTAGSFGL